LLLPNLPLLHELLRHTSETPLYKALDEEAESVMDDADRFLRRIKKAIEDLKEEQK